MGGSSSAPAPRPQPKAKAAPIKPANAAPTGPTQYVDSGSGQASNAPSQAASPMSGVEGGGYSPGMAGQAPGQGDSSVTKFIAGQGEGGDASLENVLGGEASQFFGTNPFNRGAADRTGFLGSQFSEGANTVGLDSTVASQANAPEVGGGAPGVGNQSFGSRVLIGGEGEIITPEGAGSNAIDTGVAAVQAPSDIQQDPNYVIPGPGQAYINDAGFSMPIGGQNSNAFVQNSRMAAQRATGPISRGLMSARSGFGKNLG